MTVASRPKNILTRRPSKTTRRLGIRALWVFKTLCIVSFCVIGVYPRALMADSKTLEIHQAEIAQFTEQERKIIEEMHRIDLALNNSKKKVAQLKKEIANLEKKLAETAQTSSDLEKKIQQTEAYASRRLVALYKLNQLGRLNFMAAANSFYDFIHRKTELETILKQDKAILNDYLENKATLKHMREQLAYQRSEKIDLEADVTRSMKTITQQMDTRADLLRDIRKKKSLALAAIASLKKSADELTEKISGFKQEFPSQAPYAAASPQSFSDLKGLLIMPVNGKITDRFGQYTDTQFNIVNFRSGINIKAERGEPIRAVYKGVTLYANWFKGYGNLIIIDHGNHYYTLYAHAEELFKKKGDPVAAGEVVATVGDSGSLSGPVLHFEVRYHGKPIDPLPWLDQG
jgi:septal ring factor EnvC (AmiA/AmiB activator)